MEILQIIGLTIITLATGLLAIAAFMMAYYTWHDVKKDPYQQMMDYYNKPEESKENETEEDGEK